MTSHAGRLYVARRDRCSLFFLAWARGRRTPVGDREGGAPDPRLVALAQREHRLRKDAGLVQKVVARRYADYRRRFAAYKAALARRQAQIAARSGGGRGCAARVGPAVGARRRRRPAAASASSRCPRS